MIEKSCDLAKALENKIIAEPRLELLAPAQLNIVCFRYRSLDADRVNASIVVDLHESGIAVPSTTRLDGKLVIRAALFNHRTQMRDVDAMVAGVLKFGDRHRANSGEPM